MIPIHRLVERAQEKYGVEILSAAILVRDPFSCAPGVIEIKHRCDGVHTDPVDMIFLEPEHGARDQKRAHLITPVVENRTVPARVIALPRIGMLIQLSSIEA